MARSEIVRSRDQPATVLRTWPVDSSSTTNPRAGCSPDFGSTPSLLRLSRLANVGRSSRSVRSDLRIGHADAAQSGRSTATLQPTRTRARRPSTHPRTAMPSWPRLPSMLRSSRRSRGSASAIRPSTILRDSSSMVRRRGQRGRGSDDAQRRSKLGLRRHARRPSSISRRV